MERSTGYDVSICDKGVGILFFLGGRVVSRDYIECPRAMRFKLAKKLRKAYHDGRDSVFHSIKEPQEGQLMLALDKVG